MATCPSHIVKWDLAASWLDGRGIPGGISNMGKSETPLVYVRSPIHLQNRDFSFFVLKCVAGD